MEMGNKLLLRKHHVFGKVDISGGNFRTFAWRSKLVWHKIIHLSSQNTLNCLIKVNMCKYVFILSKWLPVWNKICLNSKNLFFKKNHECNFHVRTCNFYGRCVRRSIYIYIYCIYYEWIRKGDFYLEGNQIFITRWDF